MASLPRGLLRGAAVVAVAVGLVACGGGPEPPAGAPQPPVTGSSPPVVVPSRPVPSGPVVTAVPPPDADVPGFRWDVARVTAVDLPHSWREGCPVGPESLRAVTLSYRGFDGEVHEGVLVVHEDVVAPARAAFEALFRQGFPIRSVRPVDEFGGSDDASMAADNTSGFNCRAAVTAGGATRWSQHAYGRAIDVNPVENPFLLAGDVLPPEGARFTDREPPRPGMIVEGSPALAAFLDAGFSWGGRWRNPDYQHVER